MTTTFTKDIPDDGEACRFCGDVPFLAIFHIRFDLAVSTTCGRTARAEVKIPICPSCANGHPEFDAIEMEGY